MRYSQEQSYPSPVFTSPPPQGTQFVSIRLQSPGVPSTSLPQQPQQCHYYPQSFNQQQHYLYSNQYPRFQQTEQPCNGNPMTPLPSAFSSSTQYYSEQQPSRENQQEYLRWIQLVQSEQQLWDNGPIDRPISIWAIGIIDILSAALKILLPLYFIFLNPISDPFDHPWAFFMSFLGILIRLLMGVGLIIGLKSKDDSNALWYCKLWMACQIIFLAKSVIDVVAEGLLFATSISSRPKNSPIIAAVWLFCYRVVCFTLMSSFVAKLKKSERRSYGDVAAFAPQQQHPLQLQEGTENGSRFGTGESSFCMPSATVIMLS